MKKRKGISENLKFIMMIIFALMVIVLMVYYAAPRFLGGGLT
jgi:predicted nucleic acid-binding Zn ribbon protein